MYYLQSRYYNPEWGRFINADSVAGSIGELLSHNVFAYCGNNPISREDSDGFSWRDQTDSGGGGLGGLIGLAAMTIAEKSEPEVESVVEKVVTRKDVIQKVEANVVNKAIQAFYPSNNGALGDVERKYLMPGDIIDRFGKIGGKYFSPAGTPLKMRALPPNADLSQYRVFQVVKPFEVESSTIAPAFNKIGLGTQYYSPVSAETLLKRGIIKKFP